MKPVHHIAASTIISGALYSIFRSWELSLACFITGFIIDIDHIFDYIFENGFDFNMNTFFDFFYHEKHQKIILLFHGWEWLILLGIYVKLTDWNLWVTGALIGYALHIIPDYFYSKAPFGSYSLIWKWKNNFNSKLIFPRNRGYNPKA